MKVVQASSILWLPLRCFIFSDTLTATVLCRYWGSGIKGLYSPSIDAPNESRQKNALLPEALGYTVLSNICLHESRYEKSASYSKNSQQASSLKPMSTMLKIVKLMDHMENLLNWYSHYRQCLLHWTSTVRVGPHILHCASGSLISHTVLQ
jgi:hypothetical protein